MPDFPPDQVIAALEETWSATAQMGETLHPDAWDLPTDCPGWSVRDHLSHLIGTELSLLGSEAPPQPEPMPAHVRNPIGQNNEAWIEARRGAPGTEVLAEFVSVTTRRLDEMASFPPERWTVPGWSPIGEVPYGEFMLIRIMDSWVHGQDMRWAVDRPGDRGGLGETVALMRLTSGMGYVVGRQVGPPDGTTVVFNIEGPLPQVVAIGMDGSRAKSLADPPDSPTVRLCMPAEHFVRLVCGRETGDEAVAAGGVAIAGDDDLGHKVLGSMNFMI